jgi:hypothetical protein
MAGHKEKCSNFQCVIEWPIGYFSPRGYCSNCEWREGRALLSELTRARLSIDRIEKTAKAFKQDETEY